MTSTLESLLGEQDKLTSKQVSMSKYTISQLDDLITDLRETRNTINSNPSNHSTVLNDLVLKAKSRASVVLDLQKEFTSTLNRSAKLVEKLDSSNRNPKQGSGIEVSWDPTAFNGHEDTLNLSLSLHFAREANFSLCQQFAAEAGIIIPDETIRGFRELYSILESLETHHNLEPAVQWCKTHRKQLQEAGSSLEFGLVKCKFVQILSGQHSSHDGSNDTDGTETVRSRVKRALEYGRAFFAPFGETHFEEIQRLSGAVLYAGNLSQSRYAELLSPTLIQDVVREFKREYCSLRGWSNESPLLTSIMVGTIALPIINKMCTIMKEKKNEWTSAGELPVEIPLLPSQRYHSVFACPVSKELGTDSNPPMMMPCGHVVCKESLMRLSKGNNKFKCPYCPHESTPSQAMKVAL